MCNEVHVLLECICILCTYIIYNIINCNLERSQYSSTHMGSGFRADRVIYSIAIVYSESLFGKVRENDQHVIISIISILFALAAHWLSRRWSCHCKDHIKQHPECSALWQRIVTQWLQITQLTLTFIAIHSLVEVLNDMISDTERYYYEALLFPVITLMFSVSLVTVIEDRYDIACNPADRSY